MVHILNPHVGEPETSRYLGLALCLIIQAHMVHLRSMRVPASFIYRWGLARWLSSKVFAVKPDRT